MPIVRVMIGCSIADYGGFMEKGAMPKFVYRKPSEPRSNPYVSIDVKDGEELTETEAVIMVLDQIDTRLADIAQTLDSR